MSSAGVGLPPYIHNYRDGLYHTAVIFFVFFLGSLILWPFLIAITVLLLPLTYLCRRLLLLCCIPCTCGRHAFECHCRVFATPMESLWIMSDDRPLTFKELRLQRQRNTSVGVDAEGNPLIQGVKAENDAVKVEEVNMQSGREAAGMSHDPSRTMTRNIHSVVVVLEKSLDVEALIQTIQQRLISLKKSDSNERYFPKFTQKLVEIAGGSLVWVDDSNFALSRHVLVHTQPVRNQADMQTFLEAQTRQGIPVDAPLWQLVIASGYGTLQDRVLVWRFHGAMYDGVTLAKILTFTLTNPHNILFRAHDQYFHRNDHLVTFLLTGPMKFLHLLIKRRRQNDLEPSFSSSRVDPGQPPVAAHYSWSERTLNLPLLLKNKMLLGMTFTDLLLSMTVGATKDVLKPCPKVMVPFDLWSNLKSSTPLPRGNFLMMVPCPVSSTAEVIPRLWLTEHLLTTLKKSGDTKTQFYMLSWLHCLPFSLRLCRFLHRYLQGQCSALVTSFDGPKTVDYIEGASIRDIMFFTYPPHHVQYSLNFISYSGTIKLSALSTSELPSDVIESIVSNMSQQLSQINRKVFQRYFPDGLNKSSCPYRQPQASKVFNEFMNKMMEIDALSPSTADSNGAGGESSRTHFDSSADRPLTSSDPPGDSNEPRENPRNSCPAFSPNMSHNNHSVCHGSRVTEDGGNFQQDVDGLLKLPPTSSLSVSLLHHENSPFASFKANTSKSKSMSALAEAAISEIQLLHDGKDVCRRNVSHNCMYSISEDVATASITPTDAISFEVPSDTDINSLS